MCVFNKFKVKDAINILQEFCMEKARELPLYIENDIGNAKVPSFQCELILPMGCGIGDVIVGNVHLRALGLRFETR